MNKGLKYNLKEEEYSEVENERSRMKHIFFFCVENKKAT